VPSPFTLSLLIGGIVAEPVPPEVIQALTSAQVTITAGRRNGFQLVFGISKQSPLVTRLLGSGYFDAPRRVIITATVNGSSSVLMDGVITRQEVTASNDPGQSKLTITGEDVSRMMDLIDFTGFPFPAMPAEARVLIMIAKYAMYGIVPLIVPSILLDVPNPLDEINGQQGTDYAYINALADRVGYVFYVDPGPVPGMNTGYWGPQIKTGAPQPALTVNTDAASNVESLSFSFDGFKKTLYVVLIQDPSLKFPIPIPVPDVNPIQPPLGAKTPMPLAISPMRDLGGYTPIQAAAIALAKAAKSADVISGQGTLDVLRYGRVLHARQLVGVRGAGYSYDGLYYVDSVTHNIKPGEYKQSFTLTRNALVPFSQGVPV
jgi:hypothetical protein